MKYSYLFALFFFLSCQKAEELPEDLSIVNANILIMNRESKETITRQLLKENAHIYILAEAHLGHNVDSLQLVQAGYTMLDLTGEAASGNMVIATNCKATLGGFSLSNEDYSPPPFGTIRIPFGNDTITIVGVHTPSPHYHSEDVIKFTFDTLQQIASKGVANLNLGSMKKGDKLILAGDFNSFPHSEAIETILNMGFEDAAYSAGDPYQFTWSPKNMPTPFARIDYLFHSPDIKISYQETLPHSLLSFSRPKGSSNVLLECSLYKIKSKQKKTTGVWRCTFFRA